MKARPHDLPIPDLFRSDDNLGRVAPLESMTILRENFESALYRVIQRAELEHEKSAFIDGLKAVLEASTREEAIWVSSRVNNCPSPAPYHRKSVTSIGAKLSQEYMQSLSEANPSPIMDQFNILVHRADVLTGYHLDQRGPEELWDSLIADGYPRTAQELRKVSEQLGYFKNGKPN